MTAPPPGRLVTVHTRLASITGTVVSVRRGIVNVAGQLIPAHRIIRWTPATPEMLSQPRSKEHAA